METRLRRSHPHLAGWHAGLPRHPQLRGRPGGRRGQPAGWSCRPKGW